MVSVARRRDALVSYYLCLTFYRYYDSLILCRSFQSYLLFYWSAIIVFIVWILGRSVVGVFPRLGTSRGDGQRPSATVVESASVRPLSPRHSVPLPSATALGLGIHRWPRSTCQPIIGSWREPIRILQVAHRPICSLVSRSARSSTEVMLSVPV